MRLKGRSRKFKEATACCLPDKSIGGSAAANTTRSDIKRTLKPEEVELRIAVRQPPCVLGCFSDLLAHGVLEIVEIQNLRERSSIEWKSYPNSARYLSRRCKGC